jgi:hypothetical protein
MTCTSCVGAIETAIGKLDGAFKVNVGHGALGGFNRISQLSLLLRYMISLGVKPGQPCDPIPCLSGVQISYRSRYELCRNAEGC